MSARVTLVGAGPGDPALLTLGGAQALRDADVVLYDALVAPAILALAAPASERIYVGKRAGEHAMTQREIETLMIEKAREGKHVVRLKGGDPFVFGRGAEEASALADAGVEFRIVPGVTSAVAGPAYAGIPLTHRGYASSFVVATGHEDPAKPHSSVDWDALARAQTLVLLMGVERLGAIAQRLVEHGMAASTPAAVVADATRPSQRCVVGTIGSIAADAQEAGIEAPAILVAGSVVTLRETLQWFERAPLFGKRVLVTRPAGRGANRIAARLAALGAHAVLAPTVQIGPPDDASALVRESARAAQYAWTVFLSQNGVEAFFAQLARDGKDSRAFAGTRIAAIGGKTAEALAAFGIRAELVSGRSTSEDVVEDLLERTARGDRVLVIAAQENRDIVRSVLAENGRVPTTVAAYKTSVVADPEFARKVEPCDILTFTSASTVLGFATLLGGSEAAAAAARGKSVACIGPITACAAEEIGLRVDVVPEAFTTEALVEALEARAAPA